METGDWVLDVAVKNETEEDGSREEDGIEELIREPVIKCEVLEHEVIARDAQDSSEVPIDDNCLSSPQVKRKRMSRTSLKASMPSPLVAIRPKGSNESNINIVSGGALSYTMVEASFIPSDPELSPAILNTTAPHQPNQSHPDKGYTVNLALEPRMRASPEQFAQIIDFMERNGDLAKPQQGIDGRIANDTKWKELTRLLNSLDGGVKKSSVKWKKVWADWKTKTKKKANLIENRNSGNVPHTRLYLNAFEKRVVNVLRTSMIDRAERNLKPHQQQGSDFEENSIEVKEVSYDDALPASPLTSTIRLEPMPPVSQPATQKPISVTPPPQHSSPLPKINPLLPQYSSTLPQSASSRPEHSTPIPQTSSSLPQHSPTFHQMSPPPNQSISPSPINNPPQPETSSSPLNFKSKRRKRAQTPFNRAASEFVAVEQARLRFEELREQNLHKREVERLRLEGERLRLEGERIEANNAFTRVLNRFADVAERYFFE